MQYLFIVMVIFTVLGAGCSGVEKKRAVSPNNDLNVMAKSADPLVAMEPPVPVATPLKELPELAPLAEPIDDADWSSKSTSYPAVTLRYPSTGLYSVTWESKLLKKDDANIQGNCYVTARTVYKKINIPGYAVNVCQTVTDFSARSGIRTDYFVMSVDDGFRLITFTKIYREGFDMNLYGAIIAHVIGILD